MCSSDLEGQDVATAQRLMKTTEQAQAAGRTDALADKAMNALSPQGPAAASTAPTTGINTLGNDLDMFYAPDGNLPSKKDVVEATKEVTPAKERKGFGDEDLLMLGLSLLANKSPNFLTALGEAGIQTLGAKRERERGETEKLYREALTEQAKRPAAEMQLLERYSTDPKFRAMYEQFAAAKREPMTREKLLNSWAASPYLQMQYAKPEDYIRMMESATGGGALGSQLNASDQSLIQKYLR